MIDCEMKKEGGCVAVRLKGHACFAPHGQDIVCSAASTLCNTLAAYFAPFDARGEKVELSSGAVEMCIALKERGRGSRAVLEFTATGFELISRSFPQNFRFKKNF